MNARRLLSERVFELKPQNLNQICWVEPRDTKKLEVGDDSNKSERLGFAAGTKNDNVRKREEEEETMRIKMERKTEKERKERKE